MPRKALSLIASLLLGSALLTIGGCSTGEFGTDVLSSFIGASLANVVVHPQ